MEANHNMIEPDSIAMLSHSGDPNTSPEAARSLDPDARAQVKLAIMLLLRECPGAPFQIADRYFAMRAERDWPVVKYDSIAKRISELRNAAQVYDTGRRVMGPHGKNAAVLDVAA
jgi:hypothetical protein